MVTFDELNRRTAIDYPDDADLSFAYDNASHLTEADDARGTTTFVYDALNRLTSETGPDDAVTSHVYARPAA